MIPTSKPTGPNIDSLWEINPVSSKSYPSPKITKCSISSSSPTDSSTSKNASSFPTWMITPSPAPIMYLFIKPRSSGATIAKFSTKSSTPKKKILSTVYLIYSGFRMSMPLSCSDKSLGSAKISMYFFSHSGQWCVYEHSLKGFLLNYD